MKIRLAYLNQDMRFWWEKLLKVNWKKINIRKKNKDRKCKNALSNLIYHKDIIIINNKILEIYQILEITYKIVHQSINRAKNWIHICKNQTKSHNNKKVDLVETKIHYRRWIQQSNWERIKVMINSIKRVMIIWLSQ